MRAKETVDDNRIVEDGRKGEINGKSQGKGGKEEKERRHGWGGMKGNGDNVGEDKRKEERNDRGKGTGNSGSSCSTYRKGLQYLREITPVLT